MQSSLGTHADSHSAVKSFLHSTAQGLLYGEREERERTALTKVAEAPGRAAGKVIWWCVLAERVESVCLPCSPCTHSLFTCLIRSMSPLQAVWECMKGISVHWSHASATNEYVTPATRQSAKGAHTLFFFILFCCSHLIPSFILSLAFVSCHWLLCNSCWSEGGGVLIISAAVRAQCTNQLCGIEEASCRVEAYFAPASGGVHERRYGYAVFSAFTAHAMPHSKRIVQPQPFLCMYVDMSVRTQERESYRDILFIHSFIHAFSYVAPFT